MFYTFRPPVFVGMLQTEVLKLLQKLNKFDLHEFMLSNLQILATTDYIRKNVLSKYMFTVDASAHKFSGSNKSNDLVNKLSHKVLLTISTNQELYLEKILLLIQILVAIKHSNVAPKQLFSVNLIRKASFELVFDSALHVSFLKGYDFITYPSAYFLKEENNGFCLYPVEDPSHVLKRLVNHMSLGDFYGADSNHWADVANSKKVNFQHTWYNRDQQNVSVSLEFISESVEFELRQKGHIQSANFCKFSRDLWILWDDKRVLMQQKLLLLTGVLYYLTSR